MKMKGTGLFKKGLCVLLVLLLLISLFPAPAFASVTASGTIGSGGASWRLYSDGTLRVASGFIHWEGARNSWVSPWHQHRSQVRHIEFTGPITTGTSLAALFSELSRLDSIAGLHHFNTTTVTDMGWMFFETNLRNLDLSGFDTTNVRFMDGMFAYSALRELDLSGFRTRNVVDMSWMFRGTSHLQRLDISNFDTRNVRWMGLMFRDATSLRELSLSEGFRFVVDEDGSRQPWLPRVAANNTYTGYWQNVGPGTTRNPQGNFVFNSADLQANFNGATMADTFVWQPILRTPPGLPFFDVPQHHWAVDSIRFAYIEGLIEGTSGTTFVPDGTLTRAAVVTVLYRMAGEPAIHFEPVFSDVRAGRWYSEAIVWAASHDIVAGVGGNRFAPHDNITREQLATVLYQYAIFRGYDTTLPDGFDFGDFRDAASISPWAIEGLTWAICRELVVGSDGRLNPRGTATRAECAAILERFLNSGQIR